MPRTIRCAYNLLRGRSGPRLPARGRAHNFGERLMRDPHLSANDIAQAEGVSAAYIYATLRLAWPARESVEAIINGRQPSRLTAHGAVPSIRASSARLATTAHADRLRERQDCPHLSRQHRAAFLRSWSLTRSALLHQPRHRTEESTAEYGATNFQGQVQPAACPPREVSLRFVGSDGHVALVRGA